MDSHNAGVNPPSYAPRILRFVYRLIQRAAHLTIVTNKGLAELVACTGGNPFVLEDTLPSFPDVGSSRLDGQYNLVCISTFASDEPFLEVIKAAGLIPSTIHIYITGNWEHAKRRLPPSFPTNIILTGYLPDRDYIRLLNAADIILDLTQRENCLVCGAYEGVALGKPLILSDTLAIRSLFNRGAVYTRNKANDIGKAITTAISNIDKLSREVMELKAYMAFEWSRKRDKLIGTIDGLLTTFFLAYVFYQFVRDI